MPRIYADTRRRALRTAVASAALQLYAAGFILCSDLGPAVVTVPTAIVQETAAAMVAICLVLYVSDAGLGDPVWRIMGASSLIVVVAFAIAESDM